jgi:hypothetical protein
MKKPHALWQSQELEELPPAIFLVTFQELKEEDGLRPLQQIVKGKFYDEVLKRTGAESHSQSNWPLQSLQGF